MKISLLDYGASNLKSVKKAFEHLDCTVSVITTADEVENTDILIFPGQGAFGPSIKHLNDLNLIEPLQNHIKNQKPFFGICLGFQLLFTSSDEAPGIEGLSVFPGHFEKFSSKTHKVPQIGWNTLEKSSSSLLLNNLPESSYVYFVHSYYLKETTSSLISSKTTYIEPYVSSIQTGNIWGTQFHPEKSGDVGLQILKNFISFCKTIS
jgi:imidazole glycerol-phosphate synthase subunit HisH